MNKEEILKKVITSSEELVSKYRKEHAAMMAAVWAGDAPAVVEHRKVPENMSPEIQETGEKIMRMSRRAPL